MSPRRPALPVGTLRVPDLALLSVRSDQPGATLLAARIELDQAKSGDTLVEVGDATPADPEPVGCVYAVVATDRIGAAIETNTVFDLPAGTPGATWDNGRLWRQTVRRDGYTKQGPTRLRPVDLPRGGRAGGNDRAAAVRHRHRHPRPGR